MNYPLWTKKLPGTSYFLVSTLMKSTQAIVDFVTCDESSEDEAE